VAHSTSVFAIQSPLPWPAAERAACPPICRARPTHRAVVVSAWTSTNRATIAGVYRDIPCLGRAAPAGGRGPRSGTNLTCRPHGTGSSVGALLRGFTVRVTLLRASVSRATARRLSDRGHVPVRVTSNGLGRCRDASCASVHLTGDHDGGATSGPKKR